MKEHKDIPEKTSFTESQSRTINCVLNLTGESMASYLRRAAMFAAANDLRQLSAISEVPKRPETGRHSA